MPTSIKPEDKPITIAVDQGTPQTSYVLRDVHGAERARFYDQIDANEFLELVNTPERAIGEIRDLMSRPQEERREMVKTIVKKAAKKAAKGFVNAKAKKRAAAVAKKSAVKTTRKYKRRK